MDCSNLGIVMSNKSAAPTPVMAGNSMSQGEAVNWGLYQSAYNLTILRNFSWQGKGEGKLHVHASPFSASLFFFIVKSS